MTARVQLFREGNRFKAQIPPFSLPFKPEYNWRYPDEFTARELREAGSALYRVLSGENAVRSSRLQVTRLYMPSGDEYQLYFVNTGNGRYNCSPNPLTRSQALQFLSDIIDILNPALVPQPSPTP